MSKIITCLIVACCFAIVDPATGTAQQSGPIDPPLTAEDCKIVGKRNARYIVQVHAGDAATVLYDGKVIHNHVGGKVTGTGVELPKHAARGYHMLVAFITGLGENGTRVPYWSVEEAITHADGSTTTRPVCEGAADTSWLTSKDPVRYVGVVRFEPK